MYVQELLNVWYDKSTYGPKYLILETSKCKPLILISVILGGKGFKTFNTSKDK